MGTMKMALKLVLLTFVRKSEFTYATWAEVDFKKWTWTIPADRMKAGRAHVIYLPKQAQDLLVGLQMCAGGSEYRARALQLPQAIIERRAELADRPDRSGHKQRRRKDTGLHGA